MRDGRRGNPISPHSVPGVHPTRVMRLEYQEFLPSRFHGSVCSVNLGKYLLAVSTLVVRIPILVELFVIP